MCHIGYFGARLSTMFVQNELPSAGARVDENAPQSMCHFGFTSNVGLRSNPTPVTLRASRRDNFFDENNFALAASGWVSVVLSHS